MLNSILYIFLIQTLFFQATQGRIREGKIRHASGYGMSWGPWSKCKMPSEFKTGSQYATAANVQAIQIRWRKCMSASCRGQKSQIRACVLPVETSGQELQARSIGFWNQWGSWSPCQARFQRGSKWAAATESQQKPIQFRWRTCAMGRGRCGGEGMQSRECDDDDSGLGGQELSIPMPKRQAIGYWSAWTAWSTCGSNSSGDSVQTRTRQCYIPGLCRGQTTQSRKCGKKSAALGLEQVGITMKSIGYWGQWTSWSPCDETELKKHRTRRCYAWWGRCRGQKKQSVKCGVTPVNNENPLTRGLGYWSRWNSWSSCASNGTQFRWRRCLPSFGKCRGQVLQRRNCQNSKPEASPSGQELGLGLWNMWGSWAACKTINIELNPPINITFQVRFRSCKFGTCNGQTEQTRACNAVNYESNTFPANHITIASICFVGFFGIGFYFFNKSQNKDLLDFDLNDV